jgi:hypothetical protein
VVNYLRGSPWKQEDFQDDGPENDPLSKRKREVDQQPVKLLQVEGEKETSDLWKTKHPFQLS